MPESSSIERLAAMLRIELAGMNDDAQLPSTRELRQRHGVSPVTVSRALRMLAAEGLVVARPGAGTFKAPAGVRRAAPDYGWQTVALSERAIDTDGISAMLQESGSEDLIDLHLGYLHPSLMPRRLLAQAASRAGRLPDAWDVPPRAGLTGLRAWFARALHPSIEARDVAIVPGGQAAISAVLRALLAAGEPLLVESPTYPGALAVARSAGIRPVPVPTDAGGIQPDALAEALQRTGARAVLIQPAFANPTGAVLASERRAAVLAAASEAGAFVVEDDYARWLGHAGAAPPAPLIAEDSDGRVITLCSLTKVASPSLRIGAVIARGPIRERIRALRVVDDLFVARPVQETALELVTRAGWQRHHDGLGETLARRCRAAVTAVASQLPGATLTARPSGGMHLWLRLPDSVDDVAAARDGRAGGVAVLAGRPFFPAEPPAPHLRLTYSAAVDEAEITRGVQRLAAAVPALAGELSAAA